MKYFDVIRPLNFLFLYESLLLNFALPLALSFLLDFHLVMSRRLSQVQAIMMFDDVY